MSVEGNVGITELKERARMRASICASRSPAMTNQTKSILFDLAEMSRVKCHDMSFPEFWHHDFNPSLFKAIRCEIAHHTATTTINYMYMYFTYGE